MNEARSPRRRRTAYRFEVRDHAADKAATAYGKTPSEVFEAAAYAMFDVMVDPATVRPGERREVTLEEHYGEDLLRRWLDELLFLFDTEKLVFSEFSARVECPPSPEQTCRRAQPLEEPQRAPWRVTGAARGERYGEHMDRRGAVVKAVTYHRFALRPPESPGGDWAAEMVFDV
jgi:SHS2 domain-containing protein